ncbi:Probable LRR receptor-like serine/threonine-protein kinase At3g47570 [Linum grandiflorum]
MELLTLFTSFTSLIFITSLSPISAINENITDQISLMDFKSKITGDPLQIISSWNSTTHFCNWPGITCGRKHQRVTVLDLRSSQLSGSISPAIGNLTFLRQIYLQNNSLTGQIPPEIGRLSRLDWLNLRNNSLRGQIPPQVFNCSNLILFTFAGNLLSGKIPDEIGSLSKLKRIGLGNNSLTGSIPESVGNMSSLEEIYAYRNHLVGTLPVGLHQLRNFSIVSLYDNALSGTIPDSTFNSSTLLVIDLELNHLTGQLPSGLGFTFLPQLQFISLVNNRFSGPIPASLSNATDLGTIRLGLNRFSGRLPSLGRLNKLRWMAIDSNNLGTGINNLFSGFIPSSLGNLTRLVELHLETNHFQGTIPLNLGNCRRLLALNISQNSLQGTIPAELLGLSSLSIFLDLSQNRLSGSIPPCIRLEAIHFDSNYFNGSIPRSLSSLRGIRQFNVSRNNFSGQIPDFFQSFSSLESIDLSYNNFQGLVPSEGIFKNPNTTLISGNANLCGGVPDFGLPNCNEGRSNDDLKLKIIISTTVPISILLSFTCFLVYYRYRKKQSESTINSFSNPNREILQVSYDTLFKVTGGFASENEIGRGGSGTVYKGILEHPDHETESMTVAVKVLNLVCQRGYKSFVAECEALRNARHRNLVKVVTVCSSVDHHGNDFRAIVYEFVENGSLEDCLCNKKSLNLMQRLNIAIDVGYAIDYLHNDCQIPIIHCDLKPSNILLDHSMTGQVSDFGLAKLVGGGNEWSSVGVRGTVGYAPPEYGMGSEMSSKGDVYSYGILVLEMFTGKNPTDAMFKDGLSLHNLAASKLRCVTDIVDPSIVLEKGDDNHASVVYNECLSTIMWIGVSCSAELPLERVGIRIAVQKLCEVRETIRILGGVKNAS